MPTGKVSPRSGSLDIPSCIHIPSGGDEGIDYGLSMLDYSRQVRQSWIYACEQVKVSRVHHLRPEVTS